MTDNFSSEQWIQLINLGFEHDILTNSLCWTIFLSEDSGIGFDIFKELDNSLTLYYCEFEKMFDINNQFPPTKITPDQIFQFIKPYMERSHNYIDKFNLFKECDIDERKILTNLPLVV